jgi:hypothetical protein
VRRRSNSPLFKPELTKKYFFYSEKTTIVVNFGTTMRPKQNKAGLPIPEVKRQKNDGGSLLRPPHFTKFPNATVVDGGPTANVHRANVKRQGNSLLVGLVNLKKLNASCAPQPLIDEGGTVLWMKGAGSRRCT